MLWMIRLTAFARGALRAARWFALAALVAGGIVLAASWDARQPVTNLVLLVVCLGPGAVLLHLVAVLQALPARLRFGTGLSWRGNALLLGAGVTYLLRPWYWLTVALSVLGALVLLPLALLTVLGLR